MPATIRAHRSRKAHSPPLDRPPPLTRRSTPDAPHRHNRPRQPHPLLPVRPAPFHAMTQSPSGSGRHHAPRSVRPARAVPAGQSTDAPKQHTQGPPVPAGTADLRDDGKTCTPMTGWRDQAPSDVNIHDTHLTGTVRHIGRPLPDAPLNAPWPMVEHLAAQIRCGYRADRCTLRPQRWSRQTGFPSSSGACSPRPRGWSQLRCAALFPAPAGGSSWAGWGAVRTGTWWPERPAPRIGDSFRPGMIQTIRRSCFPYRQG